MKRFALPAGLLIFTLSLPGCGITGNLKTPPPVIGHGTQAVVPDETTAAESIDEANDPLMSSDNPFDDDAPGYGVDVADTP